jgi:hypothetical protein
VTRERSSGPSHHPGFCCPAGSSGTTAASDAHPARHPLPGITGYRTRRSNGKLPQAAGPGRASPVPAATFRTFHAPYAGRFLGAAHPGSSPLPWPSPGLPRARLLLLRPKAGTNDAAGFALRCGPLSRSPNRAFDAGLRPGPFPDRAASLLPGLLAATRTGLTPAGDDELLLDQVNPSTTPNAGRTKNKT